MYIPLTEGLVTTVDGEPCRPFLYMGVWRGYGSCISLPWIPPYKEKYEYQRPVMSLHTTPSSNPFLNKFSLTDHSHLHKWTSHLVIKSHSLFNFNTTMNALKKFENIDKLKKNSKLWANQHVPKFKGRIIVPSIHKKVIIPTKAIGGT